MKKTLAIALILVVVLIMGWWWIYTTPPNPVGSFIGGESEFQTMRRKMGI
jgi:hypothetical protein